MTNPNVPPVSQSNGIETESLKDLALQLQQTILLFERLQDAQAKESAAQAGRIEQMAKSLDADRQQNVALLEQARATMEVAVALATQFDEQIAGLVEVSLALSTVYDEAQAQQQEEL